MEQKKSPPKYTAEFANAAFGFSKKTVATIVATTRRLRQSRPSWDVLLIACVSGANSLSAMPVRDLG